MALESCGLMEWTCFGARCYTLNSELVPTNQHQRKKSDIINDGNKNLDRYLEAGTYSS